MLPSALYRMRQDITNLHFVHLSLLLGGSLTGSACRLNNSAETPNLSQQKIVRGERGTPSYTEQT